MNADISLFGVFVDGGLAIAVVAAFTTLLMRKLLARAGLYRHVWHPALVDVSVFVVVWMLCVSASSTFGDRLAGLIS